MERDYIKIDGTQIILPLFQKYKNEPWVLSGKEVDDKIRSIFFVIKSFYIRHQNITKLTND